MADIQRTIQALEREYAEQKETFEKWKGEWELIGLVNGFGFCG